MSPVYGDDLTYGAPQPPEGPRDDGSGRRRRSGCLLAALIAIAILIVVGVILHFVA